MGRLLVVDDDPDVLDALCSMLEPTHRTERASDGFLALKIIESGTPIDLLATDIVMPGLHGFGLARMARIRRPGLRVLYLSGHPETKDADEHAQFGKMLPKPVKPDDLRNAVAQALAENSI